MNPTARDRERREEILDLFSEFDRHDLADQLLFERMLSRHNSDRDPARVAARRRTTRAWYYSLSLDQRRDMHRRQWLRRSPEERRRRAARETARYRAMSPAERRAQNARSYASIKACPDRIARRRARQAAWMRAHRARASTVSQPQMTEQPSAAERNGR